VADATRYLASERALLTELGDGTGVLLDLDSKFYFTLNETAICLWRLLSKRPGSSPQQLSEQLAREFEVEPSEAAADVEALLSALRREHLVQPLPG
jgi:hypothetical protein